MDVLAHSRAGLARWSAPVLVLVVLLPAIGSPIQPAVAFPAVNQSTAAMNTFVIIFRQGPRTLTDAEKQQRAADTGVWARGLNDAGHKLEPHILGPERAIREPENAAIIQRDAWPVTALLFLEARDLDEAVRLAEAHPALRYGAAIEVRPWAPPPATP